LGSQTQKVVGNVRKVGKAKEEAERRRRQRNVGPNTANFFKSKVNTELICGGSIIDEAWILSAAHCDVNPSELAIAGHVNSRVDRKHFAGQLVKVFSVHKHPDYDGSVQHHNDIMLVKVEPSFELQGCVGAANLPTAAIDKDERCYISGFGTGKTGAKTESRKLEKVMVVAKHKVVCKKRLEAQGVRDDFSSRRMICAGGPKNEADINMCQGDSGGSLTCTMKGNKQDEIAGVFSWYKECSTGVYARVWQYVSDIKATMEEEEGGWPALEREPTTATSGTTDGPSYGGEGGNKPRPRGSGGR